MWVIEHVDIFDYSHPIAVKGAMAPYGASLGPDAVRTLAFLA